MHILYNAPETKERRRELRKNMMLAERVLWERLRNRRFQGLRFLRQYSVQEFILDFYCPALRIAVEMDGKHHAGSIRDQERDAILLAHNISIVRIWNREALEEIDTALSKIDLVIRNASLERKGGREGS